MKLSPIAIRNLYRIITFGILWSLGGLIFTLLEKGTIGSMEVYPSTGVPYEFLNNLIAIPLMTLIGGSFLMTIDILFISDRVKGRPFVSTLLIKSFFFIVIVLLTTVFAALMATSITLDARPWDKEVLESVGQFFLDFAFWSIIIYAGFLNIIFLFIIEVSSSFGSRLFWKFFLGKYHKPKMEKRVFMFLDLKGSTRLAEALGHEQYYKFLNRFVEDVSLEVMKSWGSIYQYVGDEIVIIWPWNKRLFSVDCYFGILDRIDKASADYMSDYGTVPEFRVGIHGGDVLIGEIGVHKKDILYIGDVLNATSRIEQLCKVNNVSILVSEDVVSPSDFQQNSGYTIADMGVSELRGKSELKQLYTITRSKH